MSLRTMMRGVLAAQSGGAPTDPYWANVVALLHMDGADASTTFTDETGKTWTVNGDAQIDTAQSKFGGASGLFDGTGDFLNITHADMAMGTGDFTVEFWLRFAATQTANIIGYYPGVNGWLMYCVSNVLRIYYNVDVVSGSTTLNNGQWYHVAYCRSGNDHRLFLDGVQEGSTYTSANDYSETLYGIGCRPDGGLEMNGHIDEVRITKGVARYTSNFTPPTYPFYSRPPISVAALGDSTIAAYDCRSVAVLSLIPTISSDEVLKYSTLAVPGHTISQQKTVWQADANRSTYDVIVVQVGINDTNSNNNIVADYQDLIDTINADKKTGAFVIASCMLPCKQRHVDLGVMPAAQDRWEDLNNAIMDSVSGITGVDYRNDYHVALLDDGSGNLDAAYDCGDHVHENQAGAQIIADGFESAIEALTGITL